MEYLLPLKELFEIHSDPVYAEGARAYMRGISGFYGLGSPLRRQLVKEFLVKAGQPAKEQLEEIIHFAWEQPQREWQYAAMEMAARFASVGDEKLLSLAEFMITNKSWWDTVDFVAPNMAGIILKKNPALRNPVTEKWLQSGNLWLMRSTLLFQLRYKKETDQELLFRLCAELSDHKDFFIRKAIGWSLREYSKWNPASVIEFVGSHALSPLSRREALKRIQRQDR